MSAEGLIRYGGRIDPGVSSRQDCVEPFIRANQAWAQIADAPIPYRDIDTEDHHAWAIMGEMVFWMSRTDDDASQGRMTVLFDDLTRLPAALPDVLQGSQPQSRGNGKRPDTEPAAFRRASTGLQRSRPEPSARLRTAPVVLP